MYLGCYRAAGRLSGEPTRLGRQNAGRYGNEPGRLAVDLDRRPLPEDHRDAGERSGRLRTRTGRSSVADPAGLRGITTPAAGKTPPRCERPSRYYDMVNFAPRITCPALVATGLIDETLSRRRGSPPAFNQMRGPKELLVLPRSDHQGTGNTQAALLPAAVRMARRDQGRKVTDDSPSGDSGCACHILCTTACFGTCDGRR